MNGWLGAIEGDSKHAEILKIYNSQKPLPVGYKMKVNDAWCAATVSAAWLKVGIASYTGTECGCGRFIDVAKSKGIWVESDSYKPKLVMQLYTIGMIVEMVNVLREQTILVLLRKLMVIVS